VLAAPCARLQLMRGPVRKCGRGRPFNGIVRQHVKLATRIANAVCQLLLGEPAPPQFPCEEWRLFNPRFESDTTSQSLTFDVRDVRYPRLRGSLTIKQISNQTVVRWRTRASGGGFVADRVVRVTDDGCLRGPMFLGVLGSDCERKRITAFLAKQIRGGEDPDAIAASADRAPWRPSGGLSSAASPED
jgi:hypothetical protein